MIEQCTSRDCASQRLGVEPELRGKTGAEALDEHVRRIDEAQQDIRSFRRSSASDRLPAFIARNSALSPVTNGGPQVRASSPDGGSTLIDVGAERAEHLRAVRARERRRDVDDANAPERQEIHGA